MSLSARRSVDVLLCRRYVVMGFLNRRGIVSSLRGRYSFLKLFSNRRPSLWLWRGLVVEIDAYQSGEEEGGQDAQAEGVEEVVGDGAEGADGVEDDADARREAR